MNSPKPEISYVKPDFYLLLAAIAIAARHGLEMEDALRIAEEKYIHVNIFKPEFREKLDSLEKLPASCSESADALEGKRGTLRKTGYFLPQRLLIS